MKLLILSVLLLIGCADEHAKSDLVVEGDLKKEKPFSYKIGKVEGIYKNRLLNQLHAQFEESGDDVVDISYKIKQSPLMISQQEHSMFDSLTVFINVSYKGVEKAAILNYQYCGAEKWEYDDGLYYTIADKVFQMMWSIHNRVKQ